MKRQTPQRSFKAIIESLAQVWRIQAIEPEESIWQLGSAELAALPRDGFRVTIWNLCKGAAGVLFEHDFRTLCYQSDILLAQEALLSKRSVQVFCEPGFRVIHAASYMRMDRLRDGVMTLARVRPETGKIRRILCKYPEPILKTPKVALVSFYPIENSQKSLMIVNLHATLIRRKSAAVEEMEHLVSHLPLHDGPVILAGDFNTFTPGYLSAIKSVLAKISLEYVGVPEDPRPKTQALDQVFCRGLRIERISVDTTVRNSDHFPIVMKLSYIGT